MFEFALWGFELSISQDLLAGLFWLGLVAAAFFTRHLWNRSALYDRAEEFDQVVIHDDLLTAIADPLVFETYKTEVQKVCVISYPFEAPVNDFGEVFPGSLMDMTMEKSKLVGGGKINTFYGSIVYESFLVTVSGDTIDWQKGDIRVEREAIELARVLDVPFET